MQHFPSEWQLKTFAGCMLENFCQPKPIKNDMERGLQTPDEGMVCMGGDVTVLLDLGLLCGLLLHILQRLCWTDGKWQKCLCRLNPKPIICHSTMVPW